MIRFAQICDARRLEEIENTMFDDAKYFRLSLKDFQRLLNKNSTRLFVKCDENGVIVGYALGIIVNKKAMWFNSLAVLKSHQNTNAAKELFYAIEEDARRLNLKSIILEIREDNKALFRRYSQQNYKMLKKISAYYPDLSFAFRLYKNI